MRIEGRMYSRHKQEAYRQREQAYVQERGIMNKTQSMQMYKQKDDRTEGKRSHPA